MELNHQALKYLDTYMRKYPDKRFNCEDIERLLSKYDKQTDLKPKENKAK